MGRPIPQSVTLPVIPIRIRIGTESNEYTLKVAVSFSSTNRFSRNDDTTLEFVLKLPVYFENIDATPCIATNHAPLAPGRAVTDGWVCCETPRRGE